MCIRQQTEIGRKTVSFLIDPEMDKPRLPKLPVCAKCRPILNIVIMETLFVSMYMYIVQQTDFIRQPNNNCMQYITMSTTLLPRLLLLLLLQLLQSLFSSTFFLFCSLPSPAARLCYA